MPRSRSAAETRTPPADLRPRGQRTRARLLESAKAVFADRGYHAARVDDIVKLAQTSHGTFYLYFTNKEELLQALAEVTADQLAGLTERLPALSPGPDGLASLTDWMAEFRRLYVDAGPVFQAWSEAEIVGNDFGKPAATVWSALTNALGDRIAATSHTDLDPTVVALALVAMIERANYYVLAGQPDVDGDVMAHTLAGITQRAIFS